MPMPLTRNFIADCRALLGKKNPQHWMHCFTNFSSENSLFSYTKIMIPNLLQRVSSFVSRAKHFYLGIIGHFFFSFSLYIFTPVLLWTGSKNLLCTVLIFQSWITKFLLLTAAHNFEKLDKIHKVLTNIILRLGIYTCTTVRSWLSKLLQHYYILT